MREVPWTSATAGPRRRERRRARQGGASPGAPGVEAIAAVVGDVDAADEGKAAVDHHDLLVMAVDRVLARVGLAADPRAGA